MTLTAANLLERLAFWQAVLRLQDWDIDATFVRRQDLTSTTALGQTTIDCYRRARVRILDPLDFTDREWPVDRDSEATLVHELVHLHLDDCHVPVQGADGRETAEWTAVERACETIARGLLALDRAREASV